MAVRMKHIVAKSIIGGMMVLLLSGCATVKEMELDQKYENSKIS